MISPIGKIFYAEAKKGYIIKVSIDTITGPLQRGYFILDKDGIRLRQSDSGCTILYDINFLRKHFKDFKCINTMIISVNLKHLQTLLKNVKKKDTVIMFIDKDIPDKFCITIRPEGTDKNARFETNGIVYQLEKEYEETPLPEGNYEYPMVIDATDFQKIKRLTSMGKVINICIQKDNYLSFKCDAGVVYESELGFGSLNKNSKDRCTCGNNKDDCWCECKQCGEYLCNCPCVCEKCDEYLCDCSCSTGIFEAQYYSSILTKLVKLPGLCTQMQFYAPQISHFPLKIEVSTGQGGTTLGVIQVFIKDVVQIIYEESIKNEDGTNVVQKKRGKSKKKLI